MKNQAQELPQTHASSTSTTPIDQQRYTTVRNFFLRTFVHVIFWDILLNRPLFRIFRKKSTDRWQKISRDYRNLAVEMGGVLIKLGQFLSVRVDILPPEVTGELIDLRDELPAAPFADIVKQIEEDFNQPVSTLFSWVSPEPVGAASLGQVHPARLAKSESEVVIKVLRPGIDLLVETDLAAIAKALGWLKHFRRVTKRVDLDWLIEEFTTVTRNELNLLAEGKNAEQFSQEFVDDPQIYIPKVYWQQSSRRTLTLENVGYIKIADKNGIEATGINPDKVARKIYNFYLQQIFTTHFVHADPHPGNIFIRPMPNETEHEAGMSCFQPSDDVTFSADRPFQIVFVDFGMVTTIPQRLRLALKEYAIGVGSRDAHRIVRAYVSAGTLLPGADLGRLEEAHQALLDKFWGANLSRMRDLAFAEAKPMMHEYRDVIYEAPFQFQVDMLFAIRAVAILSGIATDLYEKFDPRQEVIPFAERLATEELASNWQDYLYGFISLGQTLYRLPGRLEKIVDRAERGNLSVKSSFNKESRVLLLRVSQSVNRLSWTILSAGLLISGVLLGGQYEKLSITLFFMFLALLAFIRGIWRDKE